MQSVQRKETSSYPDDSACEAAWTKLIRRFPYADAVVSESSIYEFRASAKISSEAAIYCIDWARKHDELRSADMKGGVYLTDAGSDRWRG